MINLKPDTVPEPTLIPTSVNTSSVGKLKPDDEPEWKKLHSACRWGKVGLEISSKSPK
jgi:hypothetical protein